jgi:ribosome-associated toxin RatA of RatAB toxin-antitoxin module
MRKGSLLPSLFLAVCAGAPAVADESGVERWDRLIAGEVVALDVAGDAEGGSARMQILVQAPARAVWQVIVSCDLAYRFVAGLRNCEVLEENGNRALVHQVIDQGLLMPTYDFVFESLRWPWRRIEVALVEGNLESLRGRWRFEESPEGTLVEHELQVRPSGPVPAFLVRRNIHRTMPDLLACVRGLAGGSVTEPRTEADLARCPGPGPPSK